MNPKSIRALKLISSCIAGGLAPLSFSPINIWPLSVISIAVIFSLLQNTSAKQAAWLGWFYGLGFFGVGVSWIYVSIDVYGNASPILAAVLTGLFVAGLALLFSLQCWIYQRFFNKAYLPLNFAAVWVLFEWFRAWFLTGFPWLYIGYAHVNTPMASIAPIFGVLGISFLMVLISCIMSQSTRLKFLSRQHLKLATIILFLGLVPFLFKNVNWVTEIPDQRITVALVQANIDQNRKFNDTQAGLNTYERLSEPLWSNELVIWPETAIPLIYQQSGDLLDSYSLLAKRNNSTLITGIFSRDSGYLHNSITSLGNGEGIYHKQKMVPFGEYLPFAKLLEGLLQIFDLPMSVPMAPGPTNQPLLSAAELSIAPLICYEVVYPDFVRKNAINADFLITISNDTWFGASWGPLQHLQMAAMRALENGRYMVRATNNGVSAIINEKGQILSRTPQFEEATLIGEIKIFEGRTPFSRWGSYPLLVFCGLALLFSTRRRVK